MPRDADAADGSEPEQTVGGGISGQGEDEERHLAEDQVAPLLSQKIYALVVFLLSALV